MRCWVPLVAKPGEKKIYALLAKIYLDEKDYVRAETILRSWLKTEKETKTRHSIIKEINALEQKYKKIIKGIKLPLEQARKNYLEKKWELALPLYVLLNKFNLGNDQLFLEQGIIYGRLERFDLALTALYNGLLVNPNNKIILRILATYYSSPLVNKPILALLHLKRYFEIESHGDEKEKLQKSYNRLRFIYGEQDFYKIIEGLNYAGNRGISNLYKKYSFEKDPKNEIAGPEKRG